MFKSALKPLTLRIVLNILFWAFMLWLSDGFNRGNAHYLHYRHIYSVAYWPLMLSILTLQMALMYINNLFLIPRFLVRRRYFIYIPCALSLVIFTSLLSVIILKAGIPYIDVFTFQPPNLTIGILTSDKSIRSVVNESQTYIVGNLLWLLIFTMAWYVRDYAQQRRTANEARRQQSDLELVFLKSQLNPHFLFNTLNNLYGLALKKSDLTPTAILKLSSILRYLLYESSAPLVSFAREEEVMHSYIDLELLRHTDQSRFSFHIAADDSYMLPPLLWLPLLENIFKYGLSAPALQGSVIFDMAIQSGHLHIHTANPMPVTPLLPFPSGEATDTNAPDATGSGIGLANLRKRLALLFPHRHSFAAGQQSGQFISDIHIDLSLA